MFKDRGYGYIDVPDNAFGFVYRCYLPKIGYGIHSGTGEMIETEILPYSENPLQHIWNRPTLPFDYKIRRNKEKEVQQIDPLYVDEYLETFRKREWKRRMVGVWFWNYNPITKKSELHYITGLQYLYITYWKFQGKFMDFRIEDMKLFYVAAYWMEDEKCLGGNEITKRKIGKCFGKDTLIRMYDGAVKKVQDIYNGEYVMGDDSNKRLVYGVTKGTEKMYKITANKGAGFICNESHILHLQWNGVEKANYKGWRKGDAVNISVADYLKLKKWEHAHLVMRKTGWGDNYDKKAHIISPYILGAWLGDGKYDGSIISTDDNEILQEFNLFCVDMGLMIRHKKNYDYAIYKPKSQSVSALTVTVDGNDLSFGSGMEAKKYFGEKPGIGSLQRTRFYKKYKVVQHGTYVRHNSFKAELKKLSLIDNKHIPKDYLIDSRDNRLMLLAGIIDTDGYLGGNKDGQAKYYEVTQKRKQLAYDIHELANSLGFYASIKSKIASMKREDGSIYRCEVYRVSIHGEIHLIPCKVLRKKCPQLDRRKNSLYFGFKVEDIGDGEYYGFAVDDNHLFLLADGTVVHNTARVGCWGYERVSRINNHHGTLQSKSDTDAEDAFKKAIIHPWQKLPDFFRPRYDLMKGEEPTDLRFFATARRGAKAEEDDNSIEEPLDSFFDYFPSTESAADGPEIHTYIADEAGKTKKPVSIKERQSVVRFCTEIDFEIKGKHWYTTTVEPDKGEEENYEFQELTNNSNPLERDDNGFTGTGLYTYFLPAQKGMYINKEYAKYGYADEEMNLQFIANKIKSLEEKNDTRGVSSFKRKNPRNLKEAFSADGEFALYDPELINEQLDSISWGNPITEKFDLVWKDGFEFERPVAGMDGEINYVVNELVVSLNPHGKYERAIGWNPKQPNKVYKNNGKFLPNNNFAHRCGCDPFKYDKTKDKRRSKAAGFLYQIKDELYPDDPYNDMATVRYALRANGTKESDMDILKMVWWAGCQVLFERNVNHWKDNFRQWDCEGFLMWLPGEVEPGIYTDGANTVVQLICNYTEQYINEHIKKVVFKSLMRKDTGWLGFKVEETQKFDEPMGFGFTLIAVKGKRYVKTSEQTQNIESIMPYNVAV